MATINRFTLVRLSASALDGKPTVVQWSPSAYEEPALTTGHIILGVTMTDADYEQPVAVMKRGFLRDVANQNSETWAAGDILYGKSNGTITKTRPAGPLPQVIVGTVFDTPNEGSTHTVDVDVRVLPNIAELSGVTRETLANLDVLIYNGTTHAWVPRQIDHGGDIAGLLDDDHTQYLKERLSGGAESEVPGHSHQATASAGQLDHGLAMTAASLADDDHPQYKKKHGFALDSTTGDALVTLTYDSASRKVTVTPTGATFDYWVWGVKVTKTGAQQTPTGHAASTGGHFLTYNAAGNFAWSTTAWSIVDRTATPVAFVYYYAGASLGVCFFECHSADRWLEGHRNLHNTQGTKKVSGFALSGYTLNVDSDAAVTIQIASGVIADEDIYRTLAQVNDGGPYTVFYRTGAAGDWTWDSTPNFPFKFGTTYPTWNDVNAGGAGVWGMTELVGTGGGNWVNYYLCAVPSVTAVTALVLIPGQASYGSLAAAQGESLSSLTLLPTFPFQEIAPLYKLTFHARSTYAGTHKAQLQGITEILSGGASVLVGSSPSIHNTLSGRSATDTHPASSITFTPYSTLESTDVQSVIQELLDEALTPSIALDDLSDVNAPSPSNGDLLSWDSTPGEWVSIAAPAGTLSGLSDVDVTGIISGDGLYWNPVSGFWEPAGAPPPGVHAFTHESSGSDELVLDKLAAPTDNTDLDASTAAHGLCPKGSGVAGEFLKSDLSWGAPSTVAALDDLSDVAAPSPGVGDVLTWDGADWVPDTASATVASLDAVGDCNVPTPNDGDVLTWNSGAGEWVASAPAAGGGLTGVKWAEIDFEASSSPAQIVALVSAKKIRVHQIVFTVSYDCTVTFLSNATEIVSPMSFAGQGGLNVDRGADGWFMETASGEAFKMTMTANTAPCNCRGSVCYTEVDP